MFFKNLTKCILLIPMLLIGFNAYAESCNNISPYKSGCDKVAHNQRATCERRAYEQCKWRQNKGIDEIIVTPKFQSRHDIRVKLKPYKQENQLALVSGAAAWFNYYKDLALELLFATPTKTIDNCGQLASSNQTSREMTVWDMYSSGKIEGDDTKSVIQFKNGIGVYEYSETVHSTIWVVEKSFKEDQNGVGCKNVKNQPTPKITPKPNINDRIASIPNRYSRATRKNYKSNYTYIKSYRSSRYGRYKRYYAYRKSYRSSRYGRYRIQRHR